MKHLVGLSWLASLFLATPTLAAGDPPPGTPRSPPPGERPAELLLPEPLHFSGFGGPYVAWTRLRGDDALLLGGRGGLLIDHQFVIGVGACGALDRIPVPPGATVDDPDYRLEVGYVGGWLAYIIAPRRVVHGSVGVLIGAAGLSYTRFRGSGGPEDREQEDSAFVVEPSVSVEVNVTSFMRLDLFAGFRFVSGVDLPELEESDLHGAVLGVMLKFGSF